MARKVLRTTLVLAVYLLVWQLLAQRVNQELFIPLPASVFRRLWALLGEATFWRSVWESLLRVLGGYLAGITAGCALAVLSFALGWVRLLVSPLITALRATPVASFIILALVWLATGMVPGAMAFLMVLPVVYTGLLQGLCSTNPKLVEMARVFRLGRLRTALHIYLPCALPHLLASLTTSLGLAWKSGIAAEVLGPPKYSIGGALRDAKVYLEIADLFAWTLVIIGLSLLFERLLALIIRALSRPFAPLRALEEKEGEA